VLCIFCGFYTSNFWRNAYLCAVFVAGTVLLATQFVLKGMRWRTIRMFLFIGLGIVEMIPLAHLLFYNNFDETSVSLCYGVLRMGLVYLIGTVFFYFQLPESLAPSRLE